MSPSFSTKIKDTSNFFSSSNHLFSPWQYLITLSFWCPLSFLPVYSSSSLLTLIQAFIFSILEILTERYHLSAHRLLLPRTLVLMHYRAAKWILCHMDQAWNQCRLWCTIWNQYFTVPLLNLSAIFSVANCATYLSITSFLQLPSLVFTHASYFFNTHLHSLGNLSFHGLTQHCSFHSQRIFSHQFYQFLNTISIHPTLSACGCIATNSSLPISLPKLFHCLLHSSLQTNTRLHLTLPMQHSILFHLPRV